MFIKFMSKSHLQGQNIELYTEKGKFYIQRWNSFKCQNSGGFLVFDSKELACQWYENFPGENLSKLDNALDFLKTV